MIVTEGGIGMEIPEYKTPWYATPMPTTTPFERFLLFFRPTKKSVDGGVTIYFKTLRGHTYVIDVISRFL